MKLISWNVNGLRTMLEYAMKNKSSSLLYISSGAVYGDIPAERMPVKEDYAGNTPLDSERACYNESKRYAETLEYYRQASETKAYRPEALYGMAIALDNLRRWPEAVAALTEAAEIRPEAHYLRLLAMVCGRMGDSAGAEDANRRLAALPAKT